jgi:hypothetical protein
VRSPQFLFAAAALAWAGIAGFSADGASAASTCGNAALNGELTAVTAISASNAWAVGWTANGTATTTLIERWNGTAWCTVPSPNPGGAVVPQDALYGVAATSATNAWAVGYYLGTSGYDTIILHWDGTAWNTVPSPNPASTGNNELYGVAAGSASSAWAVGSYSNPPGGSALILHWDGTSWAQVPSPPAGTASSGSSLSGVTATSSATWAVGNCGGPCTTSSLTERWNGTAWTLEPGPNLGSLRGVAATSASSAWAAGGYYNGTADRTLIEHWNGSTWKRAPSPNRGGPTSDNLLFDVAATSSANAWAVGYYPGHTLILRWNGLSWGVNTSPNVGAAGNELLAVAATSSANAWAVGAYSNTAATSRTLILRWNGTTWSHIPSP